MPRLAIALRNQAEVEAHHLLGKRVVLTLPSSGENVNLIPVGNDTITWEHVTSEGVRLESGEMKWESDPSAIIRWVIRRAYSLTQIIPQYAHVVAEFRGHDLAAEVVAADAGGYLIRIDLPDHSFLLVGGHESLPPRADQVKQWHVQHEGIEDHIAVVYRSPTTGGTYVTEMVETTASYVRAVVAPLG